MKDQLVQLGFRAPPEIHVRISDIAEKEKRSMSNVLAVMVEEQIKKYDEGGWDNVKSG